MTPNHFPFTAVTEICKEAIKLAKGHAVAENSTSDIGMT
jgi:hypothetical protein